MIKHQKFNMKNLKAKDIMNETQIGELLIINPDTSIYNAAETMRKNEVHSLLVVSGKNQKVSGIITTYDIVKTITESRSPYETLVGDVMSKELIYVSPDKDVIHTLGVMLDKNIRNMVVFENKKIIGMLTFTDIITAFLKQKLK